MAAMTFSGLTFGLMVGVLCVDTPKAIWGSAENSTVLQLLNITDEWSLASKIIMLKSYFMCNRAIMTILHRHGQIYSVLTTGQCSRPLLFIY